MEEKFEKKSSKTFLKVLIPIILIIALGAGCFFMFNKAKTKPVNIFKGLVEKAFEKVEVVEDSKTAKATFEMTASVDGDDVNVRALNEYVSTAKVTLNEEVDLNKQIMKYNAVVDYDNENLIDVDMIIQNKKIYAFAKDFFSKYIEIPEEELDMEDFGALLDETFKTANNVSAKETNDLLKDIEKTILDFLDNQEYVASKEEIKVGTETVKATKSTLELNEKQLANLFTNVLTIVKDNEYIMSIIPADTDLKEEIEYAIEELKATDTEDLKLTISLYTKGTDLLKAEIVAKESGEEAFTINYEKLDKEKSVIVFNVEGETAKLEISKKDKNTTVYDLILPEEAGGIGFTVEYTEETKYKGKAVITLNMPEDMFAEYGIKGDVKLNLNVACEVNYNVNVEEVDVSNSVKLNEFTEADQVELLNNLQNSKLYSLISTFIGE